MREEKSREGMETTGNMGKKKRGEETKSDGREKVFWMQKFWACGPLL